MRLISGAMVFLGYALISCVGLYWIKSASDWMSLRFLSGAFLYVLGAGVWLVILKMYPLSIAFPIASGTLMIGTTLVGYALLREDVSVLHLLGIALIILGISILASQGK